MINVEKREKVEIVTFPTDTINALITEEIRDEISKIFETANSKVIINLNGVKYIDSTGFGSFLSIMRTARNNYGTLKFVNSEPSLTELFRTLHLNTVFDIYEDLDECMRAMG
jgi:anti-sigma B factor antagonist